MSPSPIDYLVIKREPCPQCAGAGWVSPHAELYEEFCEFITTSQSDAAQNAWWAERGYPGGRSQWPPEEVPCSCDNGTIETRVPLSEALEAIGVAL